MTDNCAADDGGVCLACPTSVGKCLQEQTQSHYYWAYTGLNPDLTTGPGYIGTVADDGPLNLDIPLYDDHYRYNDPVYVDGQGMYFDSSKYMYTDYTGLLNLNFKRSFSTEIWFRPERDTLAGTLFAAGEDLILDDFKVQFSSGNRLAVIIEGVITYFELDY